MAYVKWLPRAERDDDTNLFVINMELPTPPHQPFLPLEEGSNSLAQIEYNDFFAELVRMTPVCGMVQVAGDSYAIKVATKATVRKGRRCKLVADLTAAATGDRKAEEQPPNECRRLLKTAVTYAILVTGYDNIMFFRGRHTRLLSDSDSHMTGSDVD
uniref:Uncharacterized protein n=1 Tax=Branchiostoma floridae TaxID=7739 RepID=C3XUT2_BRAFL|eukprot:XP_002612148.1 hypothetical protein BRAFLDRAFT_88887 [Branchiostoma floridae]